MSRIHWSEEQKAEFWSAFVIHRDAGCKIREAYRLACADLKAQGKEVPGLRTFQNWYHKAMHAVRGPMDPAEENASGPSSPSGPTIADAPELDDYTRRLEMMVRLYRTRSEAAVDAVCDRLLPELAGEE